MLMVACAVGEIPQGEGEVRTKQNSDDNVGVRSAPFFGKNSGSNLKKTTAKGFPDMVFKYQVE